MPAKQAKLFCGGQVDVNKLSCHRNVLPDHDYFRAEWEPRIVVVLQ
jgi:hypothetical protein